MKKRMRFLWGYSFVFICIFISCRAEHTGSIEKVNALPFSDTLSAERIVSLYEKNLLLNPLRILNINDKYLVISEYITENFFKVFRLPELDYLYSGGKEGRGPGEFITTPVYIECTEEMIIAHDGISQDLKFLKVNEASLEYVHEKNLSYEGQMDPLNRIRRINDTLYFADYGSSFEETNHEHIALRPNKTDSLFTFGKYPETELEHIERYHEFMKSNIVKPDGSKFAAFYLAHNKFKIYNDNGELLREIEVEDSFLPNHQNEEDRYLYRTTAWASDNFIYLLGLNETSESIYENPDSSYTTSLEIWNWEGRPVYRARFERLVQNFTVSEKHGKVYALSGLAEDKIFEYDLSAILNFVD